MGSGRENFSRAIEFRHPEYLPCALDVALQLIREKDEGKLKYILELQSHFPHDLLAVLDGSTFLETPETRDGITRCKDKWGTEWVDDGQGGKAKG